MRRLIIAIVSSALLAATAVPAAAGPRGELQSAFSTELNQFADLDLGDGLARPAEHISPLTDLDVLSVCDATTVGTWFSFIDPVRIVVAETNVTIVLDGEELQQRQIIRRLWDAQAGERLWGATTGTPVIGTLAPGAHTLAYLFDVNGDGLDDFEVAVDIDSGSQHC